MKIRIKAIPADFVVEEIACLPYSNKGDFAVYLLKKTNWNTIELLLKLSRESGVPWKYFSYGGRKDRHAVTSQYITVKSSDIIELNEDSYSLKFCGFMQRPMGPDLITGNKFDITVRKIAENRLENCRKELEIIKAEGFPNYFDDQRFGSFDIEQGFFAEKILKGHFSGALKIYLTSIKPQDKSKEKHKKEYFRRNWKNWDLCLKRASTNFERKIFSFLIKNPGNCLDLLKQVPKETLSVYFSAYQAYIWNEVLRNIITEKSISSCKAYRAVAGDYIFFQELNKDEGSYLESLEIPTLPVKTTINDVLLNRIYTKVLDNNGIKKSMFNNLKIRRVYFKSILRKAIVKPENIAFSASDDELCAHKKKITLRFFLPRGSYGTMLVKRLFSFAENPGF